MELASVDKVVDVCRIATVILLGLLLTSSAQEEPHSEKRGAKSDDAYYHSYCNGNRIGFIIV